jgi:pimeloyl-ACP methyl ester carboxylesterase
MQQYTALPIQKITINEIEYAYIGKGEGPLLLCVHGFPDNAITYEATITFFVAQGYRVVAPFLRGYYPSGLAADGNYSVLSIAEDLLLLATELGHKEFFLIGHDWGASIAYCMANLAPERVQKLITIAIPHPLLINPSLKLLLRARHFVLFQFKRFGLWYARRKTYRYIDYLYSYWSPSWKISKEHREMVRYGFDQPGYLEAALGYYQQLPIDVKDKGKQRIYRQKTSVPTLCFAGAEDGASSLDGFDYMPTAFTNAFFFEVVQNAGHFLHQEAANTFHERVLKFIT